MDPRPHVVRHACNAATNEHVMEVVGEGERMEDGVGLARIRCTVGTAVVEHTGQCGMCRVNVRAVARDVGCVACR